jgi:hypothetical protein
LASATVATLLCTRDASWPSHALRPSGCFSLHCRTARAPLTNSLRRYWLPRLLMLSSFCLPPVDSCFRYQSQPGGERAPLPKLGAVADGSYNRRSCQRVRHRESPSTSGTLPASSLRSRSAHRLHRSGSVTAAARLAVASAACAEARIGSYRHLPRDISLVGYRWIPQSFRARYGCPTSLGRHWSGGAGI